MHGMREADNQSVHNLLEMIIWHEREELGDMIESVLDEIGYVAPIPKSGDIIKILESSGNSEWLALASALKSALEFNKKKSK